MRGAAIMTTPTIRRIYNWMGMLALGMLPGIAFAEAAPANEFSKFDTVLNNVTSVMSKAGVAVVTIAIIWAGYKMIFQNARWADVSTVVLGSVLIGGAPSLATFLIK